MTKDEWIQPFDGYRQSGLHAQSAQLYPKPLTRRKPSKGLCRKKPVSLTASMVRGTEDIVGFRNGNIEFLSMYLSGPSRSG